MTEQTMRNILKSMEGITYLEWTKLKNTIDTRFRATISNQSNKTLIADADTIVNEYKRDFTLL